MNDPRVAEQLEVCKGRSREAMRAVSVLNSALHTLSNLLATQGLSETLGTDQVAEESEEPADG